MSRLLLLFPFVLKFGSLLFRVTPRALRTAHRSGGGFLFRVRKRVRRGPSVSFVFVFSYSPYPFGVGDD
jgi:hypothetical protein